MYLQQVIPLFDLYAIDFSLFVALVCRVVALYYIYIYTLYLQRQ